MPRLLTCLAALAAILAFSPASAHGGAHSEAVGWSSWFADPAVAIILAAATVLYLGGLARMLSRPAGRSPVSKWRVVSFAGALGVIGLALLSPIDAFAEEFFAVHMAQHLLLVLVAAPLIAFSNAQLVYLWLWPLHARRWIGRTVAGIPGVKLAARAKATAWVVCAAFIGSLWFWHAPATYDWALANKWGHASEHLVLLATSTAFWRVVVTSGERRLSPGMMILMVSLVGLQGSFLAALITFAPRPLYAAYAANSIDDQALGGVLMCIPASFLYLGSTIWALSRMLNGDKLRVAR
jgi:putative membrane protein